MLFTVPTFADDPQGNGRYEPDLGKIGRPKMKVLAREARAGYECRLVEFSSQERIRAYLLVPDKASAFSRCPALVMLHDHGARFDIGKEKLVRPIAETGDRSGAAGHIIRSSREWVDRNFDGVYLADSLAGLGYVVLVADALYWGDRASKDAMLWSRMNFDKDYPETGKTEIRRQKNIVYEGQRNVYDSLYAEGVIWAEKMLRDDAASVRLLRSLPFVERRNIGAFGFSMGAHRCWMLSAFCRDVRCGVALSWMTTLDGYDGNNASDLSMRIPKMRDRMDFGDIGMWLCPKPMLFLSGRSDHLFPKEKVEKAFSILRRHYSEYNAENGRGNAEPPSEPLQTVFFNGGHHCGKEVQALVVGFFDENLKR